MASDLKGTIRQGKSVHSPGRACSVLDGKPATILAQSTPGGTAGVSLVHVQTWRGARVAACVGDTRLSFNLTGTGRSSCHFVSAGRRITHSSEPGAAYLAPSGLDFLASMDSDAEMLTIDLPSALMSLASGELGLDGGLIVERVAVLDRPLLALATALRCELASGSPNGPMYWTEVSDSLASHILERHASQPAECRTGTLSSSSIRKINDLIQDCMNERITLDDLARVAGYNRFRFLRAFTKTVGMTPSRYVMHRRVRAAISEARSTRHSLASIAYATGFADQSHLNRWCKRVYGVRLSETRPRSRV